MGELGIRVIICGGRDFKDPGLLYTTMDQLHAEHNFTLVINGGAKGADTIGRLWAKSRSIACVTIPADWDLYGRSAGPIRNKQIIKEQHPEMVVAFPGGRGTENMKLLARQYNIPVIEVEDA